jgi:mannose-6-phosphate isomerase-like protein (cupin superfamily)
MTIDGKTTTVGPGTMVYMPANAEVSFKNGPDPLVALQVFAGPASAKKYVKWPLVDPAP